jgi:hypothetical protein
VLRLEGDVNGRHVTRTCDTAESVIAEAARLLGTCTLNELRLLRILKSLHTAAREGRSWGWSAAEFTLTMEGWQDGGWRG